MKATQSFPCVWGRRRSHRGSAAGHRCAGTQEPLIPAYCLLNVANASNAHEPSDQTEFFALCSQTPLIYWNQMHLFPQELLSRDDWVPSCSHRSGSSPLNHTLSEIGECSFLPARSSQRTLVVEYSQGCFEGLHAKSCKLHPPHWAVFNEQL